MNSPALKSSKSRSLEGKIIVLGVTGSIAAVRTVELARELIRNGADVHAVMSSAARQILHPYALEFATGNTVITEITGRVEHVEFFGKRKASLLLIAPCTANTIGKIVHGIDDTPVTSFAISALGSNIPIMIAPAMHASMYDNPLVIENIGKLSSLGIELVNPRIIEDAAKIAPNEEIVLRVERTLGTGALKGKKIIITGGATAEAIDPIRVLTNRASGRTGYELALEAYRRGAEVTLVGPYTELYCISVVYADTVEGMIERVLKELGMGYDLLISSAAISDFIPETSPSKIKSDKEFFLKLRPAKKMIKEARARYPELKIIGFKAETNLSSEELIKRARDFMAESKLMMVVANDIGKLDFLGEENDVYIIDKDITHIKGHRRENARAILDRI
jgi:phosphopantothenoylcysteine decarboxylase/phosphopantothenate--cysteine ligase